MPGPPIKRKPKENDKDNKNGKKKIIIKIQKKQKKENSVDNDIWVCGNSECGAEWDEMVTMVGLFAKFAVIAFI